MLDGALQVVAASHFFYQSFKVKANEVIRRPVYELGNHQWNIPTLRKLLEGVLNHGEVFENYLVEHDFPAIGHCKMLLNARRIPNKIGHTQLILLAIEEIK